MLLDTTEMLRYMSVGLLIGLAILAFRDSRKHIQAVLLAALSVSLVGYLLTSHLTVIRVDTGLPFLLAVIGLPYYPLLWVFVLSLIIPKFRVTVALALVVLAYGLLSGLARNLFFDLKPEHTEIALYALSGASLLLKLYLLAVAWRSRQDDLDEQARRIKLLFIAAIIVSVARSFSNHGDPSDWFSPLIAFPAALGALYWLAKITPSKFLNHIKSDAGSTHSATIDPKFKAAHTRLIELMETEELYKSPGLTIATLSGRVALPEHQLRRLINTQMGFSSFSNFLNHYRLGYAKRVMSDIEHARLPILTIAMDAGYSSLSTFNRVFKIVENQTPSEFRQKALSEYSTTNTEKS